MAYLHCHTKDCNWSQDDFYELDGYNPAKYLEGWMEALLADDVDESFTDDSEFIRENGDISRREVIAREFEKFARRIRSSKWLTWEQWKRDYDNGTAVCPKCGERNFDID
jgi:hypothetical protein